MDESPIEQNRLIEQYISGVMTEEESLEFEVFILSKPDWQAKVDQARKLFDAVHRQEWSSEIEQSLAREGATLTTKPVPRKTGFSWRFSFMPSALAFSLGAVMVLLLKPAQLQPLLGKTHRVHLEQPRGSVVSKTEVFVDKAVDNLVFKLPVAGDLRLKYTIRTNINGQYSTRQGYTPDEYGDLTFLLARQFSHDELITVSIVNEAGGEVIREYQLLIKEK